LLMWETTYDQILKVNKTRLVEEIMPTLKKLLYAQVERSGICKQHRNSAWQPNPARLKRSREMEEEMQQQQHDGGSTWWNRLWWPKKAKK